MRRTLVAGLRARALTRGRAAQANHFAKGEKPKLILSGPLRVKESSRPFPQATISERVRAGLEQFGQTGPSQGQEGHRAAPERRSRACWEGAADAGRRDRLDTRSHRNRLGAT